MAFPPSFRPARCSSAPAGYSTGGRASKGSRRILCGPAAESQPFDSFFLFLFLFLMPFPPSIPSAPTEVQREDRRRLVPQPRFGGRITGGSSLDLGAVDLVLCLRGLVGRGPAILFLKIFGKPAVFPWARSARPSTRFGGRIGGSPSLVEVLREDRLRPVLRRGLAGGSPVVHPSTSMQSTSAG